MNHPITIIVGAITTLIVLSYLIKDNVFYRMAQKLAMGIGVGILVILTWKQVLQPYWITPVQQAYTGEVSKLNYLWILVIIPGILWYFQMSKKWFWLSRPVLALFMGVAAGIAFKSKINIIMPQLSASLRPVNPWDSMGQITLNSGLLAFNNVLFLACLFATLLYFCFTIKSDSIILQRSMSFGRYVIMIALGAMFGNTVMTRMSFLIERMQFLYEFFSGGMGDCFRQLFG